MSAADRVRRAFGEDAPEWLWVLAAECDNGSQKAVAKRLGYSPAAVSMLLSGGYKADLSAIERAVQGAFMRQTVHCPVAGEIPTDVCQKNQKAPFAATNSARVRLYRACRAGCEHSRLGKGGH